MKYITTSFLVICSLLDGPCSADPPRPNSPLPVLPEWEATHRAVLDSSRRCEARLKDAIAMHEKALEKFSSRFTLEQRSWFEQTLEEYREKLKKQERWVQELERYEQERKLNPGLETDQEALARRLKLRQELWPEPSIAPMPREVKSIAPLPRERK